MSTTEESISTVHVPDAPDGPDCPPDDLSCWLKILLNGGNAVNTLSLALGHSEKLYWGCQRDEMKIPEGFNATAPRQIAILYQIELLAMEYQKLHRKGCGYRGQGLPPGA